MHNKQKIVEIIIKIKEKTSICRTQNKQLIIQDIKPDDQKK
jgi:hypothetical protein